MADLIVITPQPVIITVSGTMQELRTATDVSAYDVVDIQVGMLANTNTGAGNVIVAFATSMQNQIEDPSWGVPTATSGVVAGTAPQFAQNENNVWKIVTLPETGTNKGLLRFIRWRVTFSGLVTAATIMISGLGRRKGS